MVKKNLFKKKKNFENKKYFIIVLILIIIILFFYFYPKQAYFEIPDFHGSYYIIPEDKGGEKIINQDKKGLHLSTPPVDVIEVSNDPSLEYSIQVYTSDNYDVIKKKINSMMDSVETIFFSEDLYVAVLKHNFGNEFFLLYKNFNSRKEAFDHCNKYVYFLENCIIVNVKNLE